MVEAEDLRAVRERARGREWREGPAEMAVIGERVGALSAGEWNWMDRAAWYRVPTTCNVCRYTQLLIMASCTCAAEYSSDTVAAVSSIGLPHQIILYATASGYTGES